MLFFLLIDVRIVSREVDVYDFIKRSINSWDKVL
jgi:hypothetical protein